MNGTMTIECNVHFRRTGRGARKQMRVGPDAARPSPAPGRVPRVSRLMALAIRLEHLVRTGAIADYAEIARLGHVTRARVTQIMNLLVLAPDIQEEILFLPVTEHGRHPIILRDLQPIAAVPDWRTQRRMWEYLHRHESP
jgi:hypothetical protein